MLLYLCDRCGRTINGTERCAEVIVSISYKEKGPIESSKRYIFCPRCTNDLEDGLSSCTFMDELEETSPDYSEDYDDDDNDYSDILTKE